MGLYSDFLEKRLRMDPVTRALCSLQFGWPTVGTASADADDGEWHQVSTAKAAASGANWITPIGIPFPFGVSGDGIARNVTSAQTSKMFARYPNNSGGTLYPIGFEQGKIRNDGKYIHGAGHFKTPSGYVALEKIGIGFKTSESTPSTPNWASLSAATDNFTAKFRIFEPRIHFLAINKDPLPGTIVEVVITDSTGTLTYRRMHDYNDSSLGNAVTQLWYQLALDITSGLSVEGTASRYRCYDNEPTPQMPGSHSRFVNNIVQHTSQSQCGNRTGIQNVVAIWNSPGAAPRRVLTGAISVTDRWPVGTTQNGVYIWPRDNGGEPTDYTVTVAITQARIIPFDTQTVAFTSTHRLPYDNGTLAISPGDTIRCATTRATANVDALEAGSTTASGVLRLSNIDGRFPDNAPITHSNSDTQRCLSNGGMSRAVLTASSGGTGEFCMVSGSNIYVGSPSGTWSDNATITSNAGGSALVNGSTSLDTVSFYTDNAGTTSTSGTLTPVQSKTNGTDWTLAWDNATDTYDSPWFSNHQTYQRERIGAPLNGATPHPTLRIRMMQTIDGTGAVIHREVAWENSMRNSGARDFFCHLDVSIGGVSQLGSEARYKHLYFGYWKTVSWQQAYTFGCCDAGDFMKARLVTPWRRRPTRDLTHSMSPKVRGCRIAPDLLWPASPSSSDFLGFVKSTYNDPLYMGFCDSSNSGGNRQELGAWTWAEWGFWTNDQMVMWKVLEASADNVMGAMKCNRRDETKTANDENYGGPPNFYTAWNQVGPGNTPGYFSLKTPYSYGGLDQNAMNATVDHLYVLEQIQSVVGDHGPPQSYFSAAMVRPRKRFMDLGEAWAEEIFHGNGNSGTSPSPPKTSGVAGDVNHKIGWDTGNGERGISWLAREIFKCAALTWPGSRRYNYWRRLAGDCGDHFNLFTLRTVGGIFHAHGRETTAGSGTRLTGFTSDTWNTNWTSLTPGNSLGDIYVGASCPEVPVTGWTTTGGFANDQWDGQFTCADNYKTCFMDGVCALAQDWGVIDQTAAWTAKTWPARVLWAQPDGEWSRGLGMQGTPMHLNLMASGRSVGGGRDPAASTWAIGDNSFQFLKDFLATLTRPAHTCYDGYTGILRSVNYWAAGFMEEKQVGEPGNLAGGWGSGYNYLGFHLRSLLSAWRYTTDATERALAKTYLDLWTSEFPATDTYYTIVGPTTEIADLADHMGSTGMIRDEDITNW